MKKIIWLLLLLVVLIGNSSTELFGQIAQNVLQDDFETYDVENPSDFSVSGIPTGNWTPSSALVDATRIFITGNFGGTRLWISWVDGTCITSRGVELESETDYRFSIVLVSETYDGNRQLDGTYDLLVGPDPVTATSIIGGPQTVVTHGDNWKVDDSKEDHLFTHDFSTGLLNPGDKLFVEVTRVGVHAGANSWFGVDDAWVIKREPIEIHETGLSTEVSEDGITDTLEIYVRGSPPSPVEVTVKADTQTLVDGQQQAVLTFTPPVDPDIPQSVTIGARDDKEIEGSHQGMISFTTSSTASPWHEYPLDPVLVSIADDDWPVNFMSTVFVSGKEGYPVYRIPGMNVAPDGSILVFCEGRPNGSDPGAAGYPIDLVAKRSMDGGHTWSGVVVLEDNNNFDYSDPCPIVDALTGTMLLLYTRWPDDNGLFGVPPGIGPDSSNHFILASPDNGKTWAGPFDITQQIKDPGWYGLVIGPGNGIQLRRQANPARNGRLVAPTHIHATTNFVACSDDNGASWWSGGLAQPMTGGGTANENEVVELTNGDLLMNARQNSGSKRRMFRSEDGGENWVEYYPGNFDITTCDCSMIRYSARLDGDDRDRILFSGPLGDPPGSAHGRWNIGVRTSYDEGRTFINPVVLNDGFGGYSVLTHLKNGSIGLLYETVSGYDISFIQFNINHLEGRGHTAALLLYDGFGNLVDRSQGGIGWSGYWVGNATFTGDAEAAFGGASIPFAGFHFAMQNGRVDLLEGQRVERLLASPIDMNANATTYVSLLLSQALDASPDNSSQESLSIAFKDSSAKVHAAFGIDSAERFMIMSPGNTVATGVDALERSKKYLLLAKLVTQDDSNGSNYDQLYLKVFESGAERIPPSEPYLAWTLVGTKIENRKGVIDRIALQGDSLVTWSIDEIRMGTSFSAVTGSPRPHSIK